MFITEVEFPFHNLRHIPMRLSKNLYLFFVFIVCAEKKVLECLGKKDLASSLFLANLIE